MLRFTNTIPKLYRSSFLPVVPILPSKIRALGRRDMSQLLKFGNFDLVKQHKLGFTDALVSKWRSRVSGLNVIHIDYEGT